MSYYKKINGVRYDRMLFDAVSILTNRPRDGRISERDAKILWNLTLDGYRTTDVEARTVAYIIESANLTDSAKTYLEDQLTAFERAKAINSEKIVEEVVRDLYELNGMTVTVAQKDVEEQSDLAHNNVKFRFALLAAMNSVLNDFADAESPGAIVMNTFSLFPDKDKKAKGEIETKLKEFMDKGELRLLPNEKWNHDKDYDFNPPEHGESAADNWIFSLTLNELSDHLYWVIVPRDGKKPVYNYGFN